VNLVMGADIPQARFVIVPDGAGSLEVQATGPANGLKSGNNEIALSSSGTTDLITTAAVEVHMFNEQGSDTGEVVAKLHVMALPQRTIPIGIYRVGDSRPNPAGTGPRAAPPVVPSTGDIETELNQRLGQCGLLFTISADSRPLANIAFDDDSDGAVDGGELATLDDLPDTLNSRLCILLVEKSGETTDPHGFPRGIGTSDEQHKGCIIFVQNSGGDAASIATHETGHLLNLSMYGPEQDPPGLWNLRKHDPGPFPAGTEGLMQQGTGSNHPGSWLGHKDWRAANETTKAIGF
jgi:hypothetical protein